MLLRAEAASGSRSERVALLWEAGAARRPAGSRIRRARSSCTSACSSSIRITSRRAPRVADRLVATKRWDDALPVLEMLARQAEGLDRLERSRRRGAARHARTRRCTAPRRRRATTGSPSRRIRIASTPRSGSPAVLMIEAKANEGSRAGVPRQWKEVDRRYREILARHRTGISDGQVAEIWYRLGVASRALGEDKKAEASFRRALEKEPLHEPTLEAMVELGGARGEWRWSPTPSARRSMRSRKRDGHRLPPREAVRGDRRHLARAAQGRHARRPTRTSRA